MNWTPDQVEARLEEAARTERALPDKERRYLIYKTSWNSIEYIRDYFRDSKDKNSGFDRETRLKVRITPSTEDIRNMEECLKWFKILTRSRHKDAITLGRIVWAKALGLPSRKIAVMVGKSHTTCENWHKIAITFLTNMLNKKDFTNFTKSGI